MTTNMHTFHGTYTSINTYQTFPPPFPPDGMYAHITRKKLTLIRLSILMPLSQALTVFDYRVDEASMSMVPWKTMVPVYQPMSGGPFGSLYVPTSETVGLQFLVDRLQSNKHCVMLVGGTGTWVGGGMCVGGCGDVCVCVEGGNVCVEGGECVYIYVYVCYGGMYILLVECHIATLTILSCASYAHMHFNPPPPVFPSKHNNPPKHNTLYTTCTHTNCTHTTCTHTTPVY